MSWKNCRSISGLLKMSNPSYYILILVYHVSKMVFTNSTIFQITSSVLFHFRSQDDQFMLVLVVVQIISNSWIELFSFCLSKCQSCKSISSGAQCVTLQKYFSYPSLVTYAFATPPIELKLGQQIGGGQLIANHLGQSL
jgi:hypothetical protein